MTLSVRISFPSTAPPQVPPVTRIIGWRGRHMYGEGGRPAGVTPSMPYPPAVIPPFIPTVALPMTRNIQLMSYELMKQFCTGLDGNRWRTAHQHDFAMTNKPPNGFDGGEPHVDFVNNRDIGASYPRYDKMQRCFQGNFITGTIDGEVITCTPGIDAIDAMKPLPPLQEILDKHWYVIAVAVGKPPFYVRGHWGGFLAYLFILDRPVSFEARWFAPWDEAYYPNPLEVYL